MAIDPERFEALVRAVEELYVHMHSRFRYTDGGHKSRSWEDCEYQPCGNGAIWWKKAKKEAS